MVLAGLLQAVFVISPDGQLTFVNQAAEALMGVSRASMLGAAAGELFAPAVWLRDLVTRTLANPESGLRADGSLELEKGATEVVALTSPLRDRRGEAAGVVLMIQDLGRRRRMRVTELAREHRGELDHLVASLAHELNNPLSGIKGAAQLVGRKFADIKEVTEYTSMIVRQADRMHDLIDALMQLEAPAARMRPVNIHRVLNEVMLLQQPQAKNRGVAVEHEFDPSLPEVLGDSSQLQQVFLNILKNAVEACSAGPGVVRLTTRMETSFYVETDSRRLRYISVDIRDNGSGLDEEAVARLFSPFFSLSEGGHGLGLAIARNLVAGHNGSIECENNPGGGACFKVTLPVAENEELA